jgi:dihydrofolate synthase/folylpolyglutamate synthase
LASVLQEAGYKVGLYTSPHLKDYRERIKINGEEISEEFV